MKISVHRSPRNVLFYRFCSAMMENVSGKMHEYVELTLVGSGGRMVERRTVNRGDGGSIPPITVSKLRQFRSPHIACVFWKRH